MQLAHQHQALTAPFTLPRLSPFQAAIRAHRVATARADDAYARREPEGPHLAALEKAESQAFRAILATPCAGRTDAAALLAHIQPGLQAEIYPNLLAKVAEALQAVLEEQATPPGGGAVSPISLAIRAHQLAHQARQAASAYLDATGKQSRKALSWAAEEAEGEAVTALLETPCSDLREASALLAHLDWYLSVAERSGDAPALRARAADLRLFVAVELFRPGRETDAINLGTALTACQEAWGRLQATTPADRWEAAAGVCDSACGVQETPCRSRADAEALRAHLRWFVPELERTDLDGAAGFLEGLKARLADLEMMLAVSPGDDGAGRVPVLAS